MDDCAIQFGGKLPKDVEKQRKQGFAEDESRHGIVGNYKEFSIVARDHDGAVIGALSAYTIFSEIYVDEIWIDKSFRGRGYGKKLLLELENHFKGKGFNNINLVTSAFQAPEFYQKCGFTLEFVRNNLKNPKLTKFFFVKYFDEEVQTQGVLKLKQ